MKKADLLNIEELVDGRYYLVTGQEVWEIRDMEFHREHGQCRTIRAFKVIDNDNLEELPLDQMVTDIAEAVKDRVDVREYLKEVLLQNTPVEDVLKVHRIITKYPRVAKTAKTRPGCFYLDIENPEPGQENVPLYLMR